MDLRLIKEDIRNLLDKNALLMGLVAFVFSLINMKLGEESTSPLGNVFRLEGFLILFIIYLIEFAKSSLASDKIAKRIEFLLANGISIRYLLIKYSLVLLFVSLIVLLPSIFIVGKNFKSFEIINFIGSSLLYSLLTTLSILYMKDLNKLSGLSIKLILVHFSIIGLATLTMGFLSSKLYYILLKFILLLALFLFMGKNISKERIVTSFY